jgi:16S rRNA (guanine(966)-N(2))-methyltransferase RsmD
MKILKGKFKGNTLISPKNIRPLSLRVKKGCFDILREEIEDKNILDLFAGSGSLGIEAISCGAKEVAFVEVKRKCAQIIKKNLTNLKISYKAEVYIKDALQSIKNFFLQKRYFDIIFLDPPYYKGFLKKALQILEKYDIVAPYGFIICFCYIKDEFIEKSKKFSLILKKKYGQTLLLIYKKNEN